MIIFHEGLPGSGKSYGAFKDWILPAIKSGREVFAYVEGINHEKVADFLGMPIDEVRRLLFQIKRDQVKTIYNYVKNDSLVVIDELQNFWPSSRDKLPDDLMRFITEHRHRGIDIIVMGQSMRDCHPIWRRRIEKRVVFNNMNAVDGSGKSYAFYVEQATSPEVFRKVSDSGLKFLKYEIPICECYSSHEENTINKSTLVDNRFVIWKQPFFRYVLPIFIVVFLFSLNFAIDLFNPDKSAVVNANIKAPSALINQNAIVQQPAVIPASVQPVKPVEKASSDSEQKEKQDKKASESLHSESSSIPSSVPQDRVQWLSSKYRLRVGGYWEFRGKRQGFIEWRTDGGQLVNRFTFDEMQGMGYTVMANQFGTLVTIVNGPFHQMATMWPIDQKFGSGLATNDQLDSVGRSSGSSSPSTPSSGGFVIDVNGRAFDPLVQPADFAPPSSSSSAFSSSNPKVRDNVKKFNDSQFPPSNSSSSAVPPPSGLQFR